MTKREAKNVYSTMKVNPDEDNELDMPFHEAKVKIVSITDVETKDFGDKTVATVLEGETQFNVFINNASMKNLIEAFGDDDDKWIGQMVNLSLQKNEKFKNKMIVLNKA